MFQQNNRIFVKTLIQKYAPDTPAEIIAYIDTNLNECFPETLLEELDDLIGARIRNAVQEAADTYAYLNAHRNDLVSLDKETKEMKFNDCHVPAYWYRKKMSEKKINKRLDEFRHIWMELGFSEQIRYPMLESYYSLTQWIAEFGNQQEFFNKAEKDLECMDTEEAQELYTALNRCSSLSQIRNHYPYRIKKIIRIENYMDDGHLRQADITIRLNDNRQCSIRAYATKDNGFRGMSALGRKGFPMMSERDEKMIVKAISDYRRQNDKIQKETGK